jgi:peptide deformylase
MPLLQVKTIPDPILRVPAVAVDSFDSALSDFVSDMWETMYVSKGIGLAAPQVGVSKRVVVIDLAEEGCLSIPEFRESIPRIKNIKVTAQSISGERFELEADGLLSRCIQHEIDHLDGILFVDHLSRLKREIFRRWLANNPEYNDAISS